MLAREELAILDQLHFGAGSGARVIAQLAPDDGSTGQPDRPLLFAWRRLRCRPLAGAEAEGVLILRCCAHGAVLHCFSMTDEDEDIAIGRMVKRFSEAKKRHAVLRSECQRIGQELAGVGKLLVEMEGIDAFSDGRYSHIRGRPDLKIRPYTDAPHLNELLGELREVSAELRTLRGQMKDAGVAIE